MNPRKKIRNTEMARMYSDGFTLQEIGDMHGVTRERVRQILLSLGLRRTDGGIHVASLTRKLDRKSSQAEKIDGRRAAMYGCTQRDFAQWNGGALTAKKGTPACAYLRQKMNARRDGYAWEITFPDWAKVWADSGRWGSRGLKSDHYVMSRIDPKKPFRIGNVEIICLAVHSAKSASWGFYLPVKAA